MYAIDRQFPSFDLFMIPNKMEKGTQIQPLSLRDASNRSYFISSNARIDNISSNLALDVLEVVYGKHEFPQSK